MIEIDNDAFLLRFGVRTDTKLGSPRVVETSNWILPKNVMLHYLPVGAKDTGPGPDYFPLAKFTRPHYVYHVEDMAALTGNPRKMSGVNIDNLKRLYYKTHPEVKRVPNLEQIIGNKQNPIVVNYSLAQFRYRYRPMPMTRLHRFENQWETMCKTVDDIAKTSTRNHIIFFNIPTVIPPRARFHSVEEYEEIATLAGIPKGKQIDFINAPLVEQKPKTFKELFSHVPEELINIIDQDGSLASESFDEMSLGWSDDLSEVKLDDENGISFEAWTRITLGWFPTDEGLQLADLWRWLSEKREESKLNLISPEVYDKVIFVFLVAGRFSAISMKSLNTWREKSDINGISQKIYRFFLGLNSFQQLDQKDIILETIPDEPSEKPMVLGIVPSGAPETSVIESNDDDDTDESEDESEDARSAIGAVSAPQFVGKQVALVDQAMDLNQLNDENITELTEEDEGTLPELKSAMIPTSPKVLMDEVAPVNVDTSNPLEAKIAKKSADLLSKGVISLAEHKRHIRLSQKYKEIKVGGTTLDKYSVPPHETIWNFKPAEIPDIPYVTDKGMLASTLIDYDTLYTQEVMQHDVAAMVLNVQRAGYAVTDYEVTPYTDAMSAMNNYRFKLAPVNGKETPCSFQLPAIDEEAKYMINGIRYYQRKLQQDTPIRKINAYEVALTSYYGKLFVERSQKKANSWDNWLIDGITANLLSENATITQAVYGNSYGEKQDVPRIYSAISQFYTEFQLAGIHFYFDYAEIEKRFPSRVKDRTLTPVGIKDGVIVYVNNDNKLLIGDKWVDFIQLLGVNASKEPIETLVLRTLGQEIPLGIALAQMYGIHELVKIIGPEPRRRIKGAKRDTGPDEFEIVFADEIWVFPRKTDKSSIIWSSFNLWKKDLRTVQVAALNDPANFFPLYVNNGLSSRHFNEIGLIDDLFIDPIARDVLIEMKEPTDIKELFIRSAELLVTDYHLSDLDSAFTLYKGYERMPGAAYRALVDAIRVHRNKPASVKTGVDLNPYTVLTEIQKDPSVSLVEDSNPIHNRKEKENVTISGTGGRSKRALVRRTRAFHQSQMGIRAEAGVDSGDVGVNTFLTTNPNLTSLRGTVKPLDPSDTSPSRFISTTMAILPFSEYDDPKRVNFSSIQQSHIVAINGAVAMPIRTGYDQVLINGTDSMFGKTAKHDGVVTGLTDRSITIKYKTGKTKSYRIGRRFGKVTGHCIPHMIKTDLKVGEKFKAGQGIIYNSGFMKNDPRDTSQYNWMQGTLAYVALIEKTETWEDSSLMSPELAARMVTEVSHIRPLFAKFSDEIALHVKVGDIVDIDSILGIIKDQYTAATGTDGTSLNSMSRPTPRAKHMGKVEHIEVVYFGDKDDMSPSVRKIADKYDRERASLVKELGTNEALTGEITSPTRVEGYSVDIDMIAISIYITESRVMSGGDKLVLANQLKSVSAGEQRGPTWTVGDLWPGSGPRKVDLEFSYRANEARIVHNSFLSSMSIVCQEFIGAEMVRAWES